MSKHHRNGGARKPPPLAGAVDLDALRHNPKADASVGVALVQMMQRQGLVCPCGARIENDGVEYLAVIKEASGQSVNIGLGATSFHSRQCPALVQLLEHSRAPTDPEHLAIRRLAPIEWLDADDSEPTS